MSEDRSCFYVFNYTNKDQEVKNADNSFFTYLNNLECGRGASKTPVRGNFVQVPPGNYASVNMTPQSTNTIQFRNSGTKNTFANCDVSKIRNIRNVEVQLKDGKCKLYDLINKKYI